MFQTPKGMRDFLPEEMYARNDIMETIRRVFELYGFVPLQTPALESGELLTAKGGEQIRDEIYVFKDKGGREVGLRFDLTVPMCRVIAANPHLIKPFKRYATGMVWRYDQPQAGRFREFQQCDVDIAGVDSIEADIECVELTDAVMKSLGFKDYTIKLNNRKLLLKMVEELGIGGEREEDVMISIDKLEKIGREGVMKELKSRGISKEKAEEILEIASIKGGLEVLDELEERVGDCEGMKELRELAEGVEGLGRIEIDVGMVRGLAYYTGSIFEVKGPESLGSLAGGGRYDRMIGQFGGEETPAVGISFGFERIVEAMKQEGRVEKRKTKTKVLVAPIDENFMEEGKKAVRAFRKAGVASEVDLMDRSISKNLDYADRMAIPFVVLIGEEEAKAGKVTLKEMESGEQETVSLEEAVKKLSKS